MPSYDPSVPCKKCGNKVPASQLKLDLDEGKMICPECIKGKAVHKQIQKEVFHKEEPKVPWEARQNIPAETPTAKVGHKCTNCSYTFRINPETKTPRACPYCGSRVMNF
jgi:DNA-directed RNA polymerase subunit RPC12/RpoP